MAVGNSLFNPQLYEYAPFAVTSLSVTAAEGLKHIRSVDVASALKNAMKGPFAS